MVSVFYLLLGNIQRKIDYDLVPRQPYAFGLKTAFEQCVSEKSSKVLILEFGVASGAGLYNLAEIASKLSKLYNIDYEVIGFDTGKGMPSPIDYRDHPEKYREGDCPPLNLDIEKLPSKTKVYYGEVSETLKNFDRDLADGSKIGFVSIDVDFYSSTKDCLEVFTYKQSAYLSKTVVYLDDVNNTDHNDYCGELLAVNEFNIRDIPRKIVKMAQLRNYRFFKNALWLDQMYYMHVLDSDYRNPRNWRDKGIAKIYNPYL